MLPFVPGGYDRYIEPFFGGGAMYFYLEPEQAIINDLNKPLVDFYEGVRNNYSTLRAQLDELETKYAENRAIFEREKAKHPDERVFDPNEDLYYALRDIYNGKKNGRYSAAAVYYFINKTAYSGMIRYNKRGEYNVPYGRYKNFNTKLVSQEHSTLLQGTEVLCGDFQETFAKAGPDDFMFLDPPYDCVFSDYGNAETKGGFTEREHRRLAQAFRRLKCRALMVIGKTPLTMELYGDLVVHEYNKSYAVNIRNRFKSESKHILIANY